MPLGLYYHPGRNIDENHFSMTLLLTHTFYGTIGFSEAKRDNMAVTLLLTTIVEQAWHPVHSIRQNPFIVWSVDARTRAIIVWRRHKWVYTVGKVAALAFSLHIGVVCDTDAGVICSR